jgi:hypothetical protein
MVRKKPPKIYVGSLYITRLYNSVNSLFPLVPQISQYTCVFEQVVHVMCINFRFEMVAYTYVVIPLNESAYFHVQIMYF